jgi:RNA polymerase sigma factor (sigma-70 family)
VAAERRLAEAGPVVSAPAQRGDEVELFERYGEYLVRIVERAIGAPRAVVEDACSFAWLQLLRLQPERDAIVGWLRTVAINEALRLLKGQRRQAEFDEEAIEVDRLPARGSAELQLIVEVHEALEQVAELSPQKLRIFSLHIAGLSYDEICEATGYSWTQVNRHMVRTRASLRARRDEGAAR